MSSPPSLLLPAPAKLNLFLHVVGRRPDGYHLLESLMCWVAFGDSVQLRVRDDGLIVHENPIPGVAAENDLSVRAARALQTASGTGLGVSIRVTKRIPMGAGLGGGSSDAATVLLGLNRLWALQFSRAHLQSLALALGADVPFFVFGRAALAQGIGEILTPVSLPERPVQLFFPDAHIPTPGIFADPALKRDTERLAEKAFALDFGRNDLAPVAAAQFPVLRAALADAGGWRMSGSGSALFRFGAASSQKKLINTRLLAEHPLSSFAI